MAFGQQDRAAIILLAGLLCLSSVCLALPSEREPIKVTLRNSGPRYQVDDEIIPPASAPAAGESAPVAAPASSNSKPAQDEEIGQANPDADQIPVNHVSIRRIFLVPMMRPSRPDWQESSNEPRQNEPDEEQRVPFAKPTWPFLMPPRPLHSGPSHHLLGADDASRSPSSSIFPSFHRDQDKAESGGEREGEAGANERPMMRPGGEPQHHPMFDPIQMMLDMMQQALSGQLAPPMPNSPDLKKEESSRGDSPASEERPKMPTEVMKPSGQNETREDIVEIEGKKYLRKTVINRHVGENIIFMTKRLIFVPLNETDSGSDEQPAIPTTTTTTSSELPTTTSPSITTNEPAVENRTPVKPVEEAAPTTTTTTTTTSAPTTDSAGEPTTPVASEQPAGKESMVERVSSVLEKAAERLVERVSPSDSATTTTTTTQKPEAS